MADKLKETGQGAANSLNNFLDDKARDLGYSDAFDYFSFGDPGMFNYYVAEWMKEIVAPYKTISEQDLERIATEHYPIIRSEYHIFMAGMRTILKLL